MAKKSGKGRPVLIVNGPNLNMLGVREPAIYGRESLGDIVRACRVEATRLGMDVEFCQSNHEGVLVDQIQRARTANAGIIINPAAFTTTSIAILDALKAVDLPVIEVHLSNIHQREQFRRHSYVSLVARGVICGLGSHGYLLALQAMKKLVNGTDK
ncbi:MAG: type II 3-dehydroquinate dehydratase [Reyranellaceae bacterium]